MIKQANEGISSDTDKGRNTNKSKYLTGFGLGGDLLPSLHKNKRVLPGGVAMGTTPWGGTITADGPPIVIDRSTAGNNNLRKRVELMLAPLGMGGPLRY